MTEIREIIKKLRMCANIAAIHHNPNMHVYLTELEQALDKAEADTKRQQRQYKGAQDALKRVMAERAEDKKRLDFWIKNHHAITCISDQPKIYEFYNGHMPRYQADNILDLIDKAMVDKNIDTKQ